MKSKATAIHGRATLTAVLLAHYPAAYRLAVGLCGRGDRAAAVARRVLDRAIVIAPRWASDAAAERWFSRFTVLASRQDPPDGGAEAGLDWLRPLPGQQREAVVLRHGLGLDLHRMAVAMDCSTAAASNHLLAATAAIRGAGHLEAWAAALPGQLAAIVPPAEVVAGQVARAVQRRRWRAAAGWWSTAIAGGAIGWAGWHLWRMLVF